MSRVIVVGAGVIGLASAFSLRKRGHDVVVVDQGAPGNGCSRGNAGWITPSISAPIPAPGLTWTSLKWMLRSDSPLYLAPRAIPRLTRWLWRFWRHCNRSDFEAGLRAVADLNQGTLAAFDALEAQGVAFELHREGLLFVFLEQDAMEEVRAEFEFYRDYGYQPPARLDGTQLRQMEPALADSVKAGFLVEHEYHVRPETLLAAYLLHLERLGVEVRSGVRVEGATMAGDQVVSLITGAGPIEGDEFLIAAGARSGNLLERFGPALPIQAGKGYSLTMATGAPTLSRPVYLGEAKIGCTPFDGAVRFAGTMELSGVNEQLDPRRIVGLRKGIRQYFREPVGAGGEEWVGMRPLAPDGLPVLGRVPGHRNLSIATGHAMLGITLAPVTGEAMAALISGDRVPALDPFDPGRFRW